MSEKSIPRRILALLMAMLLALPFAAFAEDIPIIPSHALTIYYVFADGTQAAQPSARVIAVGEAYSVASPVIRDFTPDIPTVTGVMGDSDVTVTVTYVKDPMASRVLTILYLYPDGKQAAPTYTAAFRVGATYAVPSPEVEGYVPGLSTVTGVMGESDVTVSVAYIPLVPVLRTLSIVYEYSNGEEAAKPHAETLAEGEAYSVTSPTIKGYKPSKAVISGVMGKKNLAFRVVYRRDRARITFDPNGGKGEMKVQKVNSGESAKLRANAFTRSGYVFTRWNTKKDGSGKSYRNRAEVKPSKDTTLYAQWAKIELKLADSRIVVKDTSKHVDIIARLRLGGLAAKGEKLALTLNGITTKRETNSYGCATFAIKSGVLKVLIPGKKYPFTVSYGDRQVSGSIVVRK